MSKILRIFACLFALFFVVDASGAGYTCSASSKKYTSCKAGYYMYGGTGAGNSCKKCPTGYPNSAGGTGGITTCYSNTKSRAWTGSQVNGSVPSGCASVTAWNACSKPACNYVAYSNSAGTGDGTIKSGCSSNSASCTKTPKTVTASTNRYVSGTSCPTCSSYSSTYTKSDGGSISSAYCYRTATKTGSQVNGSVPSGCASVTAWNACTPGTCTYKDYASAKDTTCTPSNCTRTPKTVTASTNHYVSGTSCPACSSYSSTYTKSDGGSISSAYCYRTATKTGSQVNGSTPSGCASVTAWNACTPGTCTYKDYASATDTTCTPSNCTKTPKTVTAKENYYVSGATCPACSSYSSTYTKSDGGSITYNSCYITRSKTGSQVNGSTPSGCASVTAWNACTPGTCTYKDYLGQTGETCTPSNCTKKPKTVTAKENYYVSGATCPACSSYSSTYTKSDGGSITYNSCYITRSKTGSQVNGSTPSGCASVTAWNACTPGTCTYKDYLGQTGETCTPSNCTKTPKTVTAKENYYVRGTSCPTCPTGYPNSDGGTGGVTVCYSNTKSRAWTGSQVNGSVPSGCASVTAWNACSKPACSYVAYSNSAGTGDGTIKSGCSSNNASCTKTPKTVTAKENYYVSGTSCPTCPTGYPNSDGGTGGVTVCYSTTKSRAWTGSQVSGSTPSGCASVTAWNACSKPACSYVAYSNSAGTGDGTIKSGCSSNNASCTKTPKTVTAKENYYVSGATCPTCSSYSSKYTKSDGGSISSAYCYRTATKTGSQVNGSTPSGCASVTAWNACTPGTCTYKDYASATDTTCTPTNCTKTVAAVAAKSGYYDDGTTCPACPTAYPNSAANNEGGIAKCYMSVSGGKYVAKANATSVSTCAAGTYKAAHSVYYGSTSSCSACSGTTYSDTDGASSCKQCPTATEYADIITRYWYWSEDDIHDTIGGCRAEFDESDSKGSYNYSCAYKNGDYGVAGGGASTCMATKPNSCAATYYWPGGDSNIWAGNRAELLTQMCSSVGKGYWSAAGSLTRSQCPANYRDGPAASSQNNCIGIFEKTGGQNNPTKPTGCATMEYASSCTPPTCEYQKNYAGTVVKDCTPGNCTKAITKLTANADRYVNGTTSCPACSSYSSTYTKSDGGSISSAYCYRTATKTGSQVNGSTPSGCASVTAWNACTPGTCTYKDYASATDTTCTPSNCTKTPKTVTAKENYYVSGTSCPTCPTGYPNSAGGNIGQSMCYKTCEDIAITGGTNVPTSSTAYYDNSCTYTTVCDDGYNLTGTNTCSQLCTLGVTSLRTGNGVTIPLYSSALSTPSLNIGTGGGVCYGILESGAGTLNIQYDGKTYHVID